jgi:RNA polymerase sigma-70 factor, ECF subfamily
VNEHLSHEQVEAAISSAHREHWASVLATTARVCRNLDLAEDCVQDAYAQALAHWPVMGIPRRPGGWLTTVATRRAREIQRRAGVLSRKLPMLITDNYDDACDARDEFPDDRLRLIFTCCHPALQRDAQIALTLRLVAGLSTPEIAHAFLVKESAMQARITRAKKKIAQARIPYAVPARHDLPERVDAVLDVVHLVYTSGHTAIQHDSLTRDDLAERAIDLARMLHHLLPDHADVKGLLALLLLTQARRPARTNESGELVLLQDQDRSNWDCSLISEGLHLLTSALQSAPVHRYSVLAAIAACHDEAPSWEETDWKQIRGLYDLLLARWPSPVVELNRAVAISFTDGPEQAIVLVERLASEPSLVGYPYLEATRADLLRRLDRRQAAAEAYRKAANLTSNPSEARFLMGQAVVCEKDDAERPCRETLRI